MIDHPLTDPGDGRTECQTCGKWIWPVTHSCKHFPVTAAARRRAGLFRTWDALVDEPDDVHAVNDRDGDPWRRDGDHWCLLDDFPNPTVEQDRLSWNELLRLYGPLTEAADAG